MSGLNCLQVRRLTSISSPEQPLLEIYQQTRDYPLELSSRPSIGSSTAFDQKTTPEVTGVFSLQQTTTATPPQSSPFKMSQGEMQLLTHDSYDPFALGPDALDLGSFLGLDATPFESPLMSEYLPSLSMSPQSRPTSAAHSPASTESEQSLALDPLAQAEFDFDFDSVGLDMVGIEQAAESFTNWPSLPFIQQDAVTVNPASFFDLGKTVVEDVATAIPATETPVPAALIAAITALDNTGTRGADLVSPFTATSLLSSPATAPSPALQKRKSSDDSAAGPPRKRRGRPPKASVEVSPSQEGDSPLPRDDTDREVAKSDICAPKLTKSGKPSTARPRKTVPDKFFDRAERLFGMTGAQMNEYANFEHLLKTVAPENYDAAVKLGEEIEAVRIVQNAAAMKGRGQTKKDLQEAKDRVTQLEGHLSDAQGQLSDIRAYLRSLVDLGIVPASSANVFLG